MLVLEKIDTIDKSLARLRKKEKRFKLRKSDMKEMLPEHHR